MSTWDAQATVSAEPEEVLNALTSPEALYRWSPVDFEIEDLDSRRLDSGSKGRVSGLLAGHRIEFDIAVLRADPRRFLLKASGPVGMEVDYAIAPVRQGSLVSASVTVRRCKGLFKDLVSRAVNLVLSLGALERALLRLTQEVEANSATKSLGAGSVTLDGAPPLGLGSRSAYAVPSASAEAVTLCDWC